MATAFYIEYPRITAIELAGSSRKPRLKRVVVGDLPEPRNDDGTPVADRQGYLNTQIAAFVKEHKLTGGKHYLLVGPDGMRFRDMKLAFSDRRQIDKVIQFQVESVIPNMPIDELKVGYSILNVEPDGARILVHAGEKKYIRERIIALEEAGCAVEAVDSHLSGTLNVGLLHPELGKGLPPALWIDFAGTTATVTVVEDGEAYATRVFVSPYLAKTQAEKAKEEGKTAAAGAEQRYDEFHGTQQERDEYVLMSDQEAAESGVPEGEGAPATLPESESVNIGEEEVADRIKHMTRDELLKFVNRVAVEARRTLMMSQYDAEPERLVVSGLGEAGDQLVDLLGNELMLDDCRSIELMDVVNPPDKNGERKVDAPDVGEVSYLSGVAMKGLGRDHTGIDFRYGDLAPGTWFDYAKTPLAFTATLILLFAGIMFLISFAEVRRYERDIATLRDQPNGPKYHFDRAFHDADKPESRAEERERAYPSIPDDPAAEIRAAHKRLKDHQDRLQGKVSTNFPYPHHADEMLVGIFQVFERAKTSYDFALLGVDVRERSVNIDYLASLTETSAERRRLGVDEDFTEEERIYAEFIRFVNEHPEWFEGSPTMSTPKGQMGPEGREANRVTLRLQVKKIEQPRRERGRQSRSSR